MLTGSRVRRIAVLAAPSVLTAVVCFGVYGWYRRYVLIAGKDLNRAAWEASFVERGLPSPPSGPRDGYWMGRVGPKVPDLRVGWRERTAFVPDLLDIDENGWQRFSSGVSHPHRIVVLGGSVAFGAYASSIDATYFHVMGRVLRSLALPVDITVVAAGAWKAVQEVNALAAYGDSIQPDLVVLLDGLNDLTNGATAGSLFGEPVVKADGSPWTPEYHAHDYAERVANYVRQVERASAIARSLGSETLVVLQPSLVERNPRTALEETLLARSIGPYGSATVLSTHYEAMRVELHRRAEAGMVHLLDCSRVFQRERATTFTDLWHFTDPGHAILGREIAREVAVILAARGRAGGESPGT